MSEKSLQQRIQNYLALQPGVWVSGDEIEKKSQAAGYKASTGSRRARELAEDEIIDRKEVDGIVYYAAKQSGQNKHTVRYEYHYDPYRQCMVEQKIVA